MRYLEGGVKTHIVLAHLIFVSTCLERRWVEGGGEGTEDYFMLKKGSHFSARMGSHITKYVKLLAYRVIKLEVYRGRTSAYIKDWKRSRNFSAKISLIEIFLQC